MSDKYIFFEFNYASTTLVPYNDEIGSSSKLLKNVLLKLGEPDFPVKEKVIDRNENQKDSVKRELVIISNRFEGMGKRYYGKIALIKNKRPLIWHGKDLIEEIEKKENSQFIEVTNFVINFNDSSEPIIMHEFNSEGPRLSDIIYYIRQIAKKHRIAKYISSSLHLNTKYEDLDKEISNVFNVKIKTNVAYNVKLDWFKHFRNINEETGYSEIKLELLYKRKKKLTSEGYEKNIKGLGFVRDIISWLNMSQNNIEYLEDLKMTYQTDNSDEIIELDFLKNKVVSYIKVKLFDGKTYRPVDFKDVVGYEFNKYLTTGSTTNEEN